MRTNWEASRQGWAVFIDHPEDPALGEFGFPEAAAEWLRAPGERFDGWEAVEAISPAFMARVRGWLEVGLVQAVCMADAHETRSGGAPDVVRPGSGHSALLGPDWTDEASRSRSGDVPEWVYAVSLPFEPACDSSPEWAEFTGTSEAFRSACELLAGVTFGGLADGSRPVIQPCSSWDRRPSGRVELPPPLSAESGDAEVRTLQVNYYGVATHLVAPGHMVLTDARGGLRFLKRRPEAWLAAELEGGTRRQPAKAGGDG